MGSKDGGRGKSWQFCFFWWVIVFRGLVGGYLVLFKRQFFYSWDRGRLFWLQFYWIIFFYGGEYRFGGDVVWYIFGGYFDFVVFCCSFLSFFLVFCEFFLIFRIVGISGYFMLLKEKLRFRWGLDIRIFGGQRLDLKGFFGLLFLGELRFLKEGQVFQG